jgi:membrane protease YdiL (CAAX protease family)
MPVAIFSSAVNWLSASIARTTKIVRKRSRRRIRKRVRVERDTCETAGDMERNLTAGAVEEQARQRFPYSNWGPGAAVLGVVLALGAGILMSIPPALIAHGPNGDLTTFGNVAVQLATALGFLLVPMAVASWRGASSMREILQRLGVRRFDRSALKWMAAAVGAYLLFAMLYSLVIVEPKQEDIAEGFGAVPVQILLIAIAAPVSEEVCFRGMLYGGLREKLPRLAAALISGLVFGALHAVTGVSAVPPLIVFGVLLSLLYERTGSIVPGVILHMLNNSVALLAQ